MIDASPFLDKLQPPIHKTLYSMTDVEKPDSEYNPEPLNTESSDKQHKTLTVIHKNGRVNHITEKQLREKPVKTAKQLDYQHTNRPQPEANQSSL